MNKHEEVLWKKVTSVIPWEIYFSSFSEILVSDINSWIKFIFNVIVTNINFTCMLLLFDVTTLKITRKPVKLKKEYPAGCAGEGKQSKGK